MASGGQLDYTSHRAAPAHVGHEALEADEVRAAPVDAPTVAALPERTKTPIHTRRHEAGNVRPRNSRQKTVADHAACERANRAFQVQCVDELLDLFLGLA